MPRIYERKGAARLSEKVVIPLTVSMVELLERKAEEKRVTKTELARQFLLAGLVS